MGEANISWVTPHLATGGDLSYDPTKARAQFKELLGYKLALVIDCREEASDETLWLDTPVTYLHVPTDDRNGHHIPAELFNTAVQAAMAQIDKDRKVFVHCHMGVNRGPSVAFAILLQLGYSPVDAFDKIREARDVAALAYAEDALRAHYLRNPSPDSLDQMIAFREHVDSAFTIEERRRINHVIRTNHETDKAEWLTHVKGK